MSAAPEGRGRTDGDERSTGDQRSALEALLDAASPAAGIGSDELDAGLQAAPFGPRGLRLRARVPQAGVEASAWDAASARVACEAEALDARQLARLSSAGAVGPEPARPGRLLFAGRAEALRSVAEDEPALSPLYAAHVLATRAPAPPRTMGVVNVTPDSFSDGGRFLDPTAAIEHGLALAAAGADLLDVGAESTRPGADPVSEDEERRRVLPVVEGLVDKCDIPVSIDTTKAGVARDALAAGARIVNDVSAGTLDPELLTVAGEAGAELVLMHMRGTPRTMQVDPRYDDVVQTVVERLRERAAAAWRAGVSVPRLLVDPGIGFGKRVEDNLALIRALPELRSLGRPILLGVSRKSFLGHLGGIPDAGKRLTDTAAAVTAGILLGADVLRVHDVAALAPAIRVAAALARPARS